MNGNLSANRVAKLAIRHFGILAFGLALLISVAAGLAFSEIVESRNARLAAEAIARSGEDWAILSYDGNEVGLTGTAPTVGHKLAAIAAVSEVVGRDRVIDRAEVAADAGGSRPQYSFRLLQREDQAVLSGRFPDAESQNMILQTARDVLPSVSIMDYSSISDSQPPDGWSAAIGFAEEALRLRPDADLSFSGDLLKVSFLGDSEEHRTQVASALERIKPGNIELDVSVPSPLPLLPFTLEYSVIEGSAELVSCHAESIADRDRIIAAVQSAGQSGGPDCNLGLGAPDANWADTMILAIENAYRLGNASVYATGTDIVFTGGAGIAEVAFQRAVERLAEGIKGNYNLKIVPPEQDAAKASEVEYVAVKASDGTVTLRGNLQNEQESEYLARYAKALFKTSEVQKRDEFGKTVPDRWTDSLLLGLKALEMLDEGEFVLGNEQARLRGTTNDVDANNAAKRLVASADFPFDADIEFIVPGLPAELPPSPERCIALVSAELESNKILFGPGSDRLLASNYPTLSSIARLLIECSHVRMEIGGHTDSQGREEMNKSLSLKRAEAVLDELSLRGAAVVNLIAVGYGEEHPIANNATPEGRDINRRIEFRLLPQPGMGQPR